MEKENLISTGTAAMIFFYLLRFYILFYKTYYNRFSIQPQIMLSQLPINGLKFINSYYVYVYVLGYTCVK